MKMMSSGVDCDSRDVGLLRAPSPKPENNKIYAVQWLRFVAAAFVMLFHVSEFLRVMRGDEFFFKVFPGAFGGVGVAIFFAISGWLMFRLIRSTDKWNFILHRGVRIYPIFIIISIAVVLLHGVQGYYTIDWVTLSLVPPGPGRHYVLGLVEWTLLFEMTFYVIMVLISALNLVSFIEIIAVAWLLVILIVTAIAPVSWNQQLTPTMVEVPFAAASAAFVGGLLIDRLVRWNVFHPIGIVLVCAFSFVCGNFSLGVGRLITGVIAVFIVGFVVSAPAQKSESTSIVQRLATRLGDSSYALYLCHVSVIFLVLDVSSRIVPHPSTAVRALEWVVSCALVIMLSLILGKLDMWLYEHLKKLVDGLSSTITMIIGSSFVTFFIVMGLYQAWPVLVR